MSFVLVINLGTITPDAPVEVIPGHVIKRASDQQVQHIKPQIERFLMGSGRFGFSMNPYENDRTSGAGGQWNVVALPRESWRYFIVEFDGPNTHIPDLETAMDLSPLGLGLGFSFVNIGSGVGFASDDALVFHSIRALEFMGQAEQFVSATPEQIRDIGRLFELWTSHDHATLDLRSVVGDVRDLKRLERRSRFQVLGRFAVIESLLTHAPKPGDPYDSITRQVTNKIALLNSQFEQPLDYSVFGGANAQTVWKKLYAVRSNIAHGTPVDFTNSEIRILRDIETVSRFLKETVRRLLVQALHDPVLVRDLKSC